MQKQVIEVDLRWDKKIFKLIRDNINKVFEPFLEDRTIKEVDSWDATVWDGESTEDYCAACLIDVNAAADRDEKVKSHCKLPVREPGDASDVFVDKAVYAAAGGRGISGVVKPDDVSADDWDSAVKSAANKIISAYNEMDETAPDSVYEAAGKEPPERERALSGESLFNQIWDAILENNPEMWLWLNDIYWDDDGSTYAVITAEGKLYKVPFEIAGSEVEVSQEMIEVVPEFKPRSILRIIRQADGRVRWLSISATSVLNRASEIDAMALFDSFVEHAEETGEYPYRTFYHQGEALRTGQADLLARDGYCYITSGLYDEGNELAEYEIRALEKDPDYWGESIGFEAEEYDVIEIAEDVKVPVFIEGVHREISTLPADRACSLFTRTITSQEVNRMRQEVKDALLKLTDDEDATEKFAGMVDNTNLRIDEERLITREGEEPDPEALEVEEVEEEIEEEEPEVVEQTALDIGELELDDEAIQEIADRAAESVGPMFAERDNEIAKMRETIDNLQAEIDKLATIPKRVEALELDEDEKRQLWLEDQPRKKEKVVVSYRPRTAHADEADESDMESKAKQTLEKLPAYK